jgi:hypothetical protein
MACITPTTGNRKPPQESSTTWPFRQPMGFLPPRKCVEASVEGLIDCSLEGGARMYDNTSAQVEADDPFYRQRVLLYNLGAEWETLAPGIYRLREDRPDIELVSASADTTTGDKPSRKGTAPRRKGGSASR